MPEDSKPPTPSASVSIARQPIFDENRRLWGYELSCVGEGPSARPERAPENTAINVAASAYAGLQHILNQGQKIMLNVDEMGILDDMPYALPPVYAAIQVDDVVEVRVPSGAGQSSRVSPERSGFVLQLRVTTLVAVFRFGFGAATVLACCALAAMAMSVTGLT